MKINQRKAIEWFVRLALSAGFLSAVADRLGIWSKSVSVWGNWVNFLAYTKLINPWFPEALIPAVGFIATASEVVLAVLLLTRFKTPLIAKCSGFLLLMFALAMALSGSIKAPLDYSVFSAAAASFALGVLTESKK